MHAVGYSGLIGDSQGHVDHLGPRLTFAIRRSSLSLSLKASRKASHCCWLMDTSALLLPSTKPAWNSSACT